MPTSQVVVITGAARGIGLGIAECFAAKKARIVVSDIDYGVAKAAAGRIRQRGARAASCIACDVSDRGSVETLVGETAKRYGRIDVLVNNAGICPFVDVMQMDPAIWQRTLDVNLTGWIVKLNAACSGLVSSMRLP